MFLKTVKSKGKQYLYLCSYNYLKPKKIVYGFGRRDQAIENMLNWQKDFTKFPAELLQMGCSREDLDKWIQKLNKNNRINVC